MLTTISTKIKLAAIALVALVIVGFAVMSIGSKTGFKIVKMTPSGSLPTSTSVISMEFNKKLKALDQQGAGFLKADPSTNLELDIREKSLVITLKEAPQENTDFKLIFSDLMSEGGDTFSETITYKVKYVPYNKLSKEEQKRQAANSVSPIERHPLLSILPYDAISYRIEYVTDDKKFGTASDWKAEKDNFQVLITTFALKDGTDEAYRQKHRNVRELAKKWIQELGVNPDTDINIVWRPNDSDLNGQSSPDDEFTGDGENPTNESGGGDTTTEPYLETLPQ